MICHGRFGRFETHIIEVFLLSRVTRNCNSQCQSCDDEFRSQIFRDHDSSKIHTENPGELSDGTSIPRTSITVAILTFKTGPIS